MQNDETIDQYVTELRTKARTCEFGDLTDSLIRDRFICGIPDNGLRERLLRTQDLTLDKAISICRAAENTKEHLKEMASDTMHTQGHVHGVHMNRRKVKAKNVIKRVNYTPRRYSRAVDVVINT